MALLPAGEAEVDGVSFRACPEDAVNVMHFKFISFVLRGIQ
jgi:hypothetical protein